MDMKKYILPKKFAENWLQALLNSDELMHGRGYYWNPNTNKCCAMGLGLIVNGVEFNERGDMTKKDSDDVFANTLAEVASEPSLWYKIYDLNDNMNLSFKEIELWVKQNIEFV